MSDVNFDELTLYAKRFSGLTPEHEATLNEIKGEVLPHLKEVTTEFYGVLQTIPKAAPFLEGRIDSLSATHLQWMEQLFSGPYDNSYTQKIYKVGDVHVRVKLPVEFMAGAMTLISERLYGIICKLFAADTAKIERANRAVAAVTGYSLMIMQQSYQASTLVQELERFLAITGMSRTLFNNLASAYKD
jgi:truncated hemoglobin YjbI